MSNSETDRIEFRLAGRPLLAEPYHARLVGLPNVYLLNGVTVEHDPEHGELIVIENLDGLHTAIARAIIDNPADMTGPAFKFLRKLMGLTQAELAQRMRIGVQTVANYEKGTTKLFGASDALMRMLYPERTIAPQPRSSRAKAHRQSANWQAGNVSASDATA